MAADGNTCGGVRHKFRPLQGLWSRLGGSARFLGSRRRRSSGSEMADAAAEVDAAAPAPQQDAGEDDDEVTDEDEDDYLYQAHYDRADRGKSRHMKRRRILAFTA